MGKFKRGQSKIGKCSSEIVGYPRRRVYATGLRPLQKWQGSKGGRPLLHNPDQLRCGPPELPGVSLFRLQCPDDVSLIADFCENFRNIDREVMMRH